MKKRKNLKRIIAGLLALGCITLGNVSAKADEKKMGDVNRDGKIDSADAVLVLRYSIGLEEIEDDYIQYADVDNDGDISSNDAVEILRYSIGLPGFSDAFIIDFPEQLTYSCGDRFTLEAAAKPIADNVDTSKITFEYSFPEVISSDGSGETVLEYTNTGKIKAYHPGQVTVTATASNGKTAKCVVTVVDSITVSNISVGDNNLQVTKHMMTKNDAYNETNDFTQLDGIIVHSTATPGVMANAWYNAWNRPNTDVAVHAFLDDEGVYQYLPFEQIAWHAGQPANRTYIDFEICEPSGFYYSNNVITGYNVAAQQAYFDKIWKNATVYTAYLCKTYGLTADSILSHAEASYKGIATSHGDPDHWFKLHQKTMNDFRRDVQALMDSPISVTIISSTASSSQPSYANNFDFFSANDATPFDMFKVWGDESLRY